MKMDNENDETMTAEDNMIVGLQGMIQDQIVAHISETQIECIQENADAIYSVADDYVTTKMLEEAVSAIEVPEVESPEAPTMEDGSDMEQTINDLRYELDGLKVVMEALVGHMKKWAKDFDTA